MIPSLVVDDIRSALVEYLASTFALSDDDVRNSLTSFLTDQSDGVFRGPFLRVRTPFVAVEEGWDSPLDWQPDGFTPYAHQAAAFDRLSSRDSSPEPTIVTTGTGSGKTECFLHPILDHCARARAAGEKGIKALILYPMNALASDQAGRIAELIHSEPVLAGITAGLYLGEQGRHSGMTAEHLIDQRAVMRSQPPDILLTNYKMLDFLLLRPEDRDLWAQNSAETMQYVVLDEFHTYDGAQGTDVAMLLRRLGMTLGMNTDSAPLGVATPVATSATLASDAAALGELRGFAGKVFGTTFDEKSLVGETRQTVEAATLPTNYYLSIPSVQEVLDAEDVDAVAAAFCRQDLPGSVEEAQPNFNDPVALGELLLAHPLTRAVLSAVGDRSYSWPDTVAEVINRAPEWGRVAMTDPGAVEKALARYLWLLSLARRDVGGIERPLFTVEVQLWVREVSRLLRAVDELPAFRWLDSGGSDHEDETSGTQFELPAIYCRRCGMSGWMAVQSELNMLLDNPRTIYQAAADGRPTIRSLIRASAEDPAVRWYDPATRSLQPEPEEDTVPVLATLTEDDARANACPACGERDAIRFLGLRVASLTSVSINTLFASPHLDEHERKLLAFTDSVQDASHRAAFFAGRTHRINLRTLMSSAIRAAEEPMSLADLGDLLIVGTADDKRALFELTPPDLVRHPTIRTLWGDKPASEGREILQSRIGFEVDLEFGLRSRVGRTLELSDVASAAVEPLDPQTLDLVLEDIGTNAGELPDSVVDGLGAYVRGMLERLRLRGALVHDLLDAYVSESGAQWFVWGGRPDGLPPFTPGQGRPSFATLAAKGEFDSLKALSSTATWWVDWAVRSLGAEPAQARDINSRLFPLLAAETDTVVERNGKAGRVFGLDRRFVYVSDVPDPGLPAGVRCAVCGNRHAVPQDNVDSWVGSPCLRYRCPGTYDPDPPREINYYRTLYRSGITRRVVTGEHTGLLGRHAREDLEEAFKDGTAPDAPNVLTATPTLEMGIDIGDLSAVMLTSVPRNPASYIQRVGRAGRQSGNSLVATFVPTNSHGLYYLAEPEAMISGVVRPPNCHLDAVDTLRRQYIAFLIDRCADGTIAEAALPRTASNVFMKGLDEGSFLAAVVHASTLDSTRADEFLALFGEHLAEVTVESIREFAESGIELRVKNAVEDWQAELKELTLRRDRLNGALEKAEEQAKHTGDNSDVQSLKGERSGVVQRMQDLRGEYPLSALERVGLLPNYTLLDDAVTLEATLWSSDENDEFTVEEFDYQRGGSLAVREFAPGNSFYAGGHRHVVDALDIGSPSQPLYETWRLCPDCGFGAVEVDEVPTHCPRCGSHVIVDVGTRSTLLRLRTAYSSSSEERARVYDEDDDRKREQFNTITTVDVDPHDVEGAWNLEDTAFGAELARGAKLRTINLGFAERNGESKPIAGQDRHVTGFSLCRHCGAARDARNDQNGQRPERLHHGWCKVRSGALAQQWDNVLLYHELATDAVRFLLPVSMFEVDERLASFKGALLLGLRDSFGGDPDHLRITVSDMPNHEGQGRRNFLVLYDSVPGGTGYLARLADPDRVREILESARLLIAKCPCQGEARRACHRCLLGVVDRNEYDLVRRDLALSLLDDLLGQWNPQPVDTVAGIDIGLTEESELERRFKVALHDWAAATEGISIKPLPGKKKDGRIFDAFELRISPKEGEPLRYRLDEQEGLSTTPSTIPDFVFRRMDATAPDVAVYLDGFQFHASAANPNIAKDAGQRRGIRVKDKLVWNMNWADVDEFHKAYLGDAVTNVPRRPLLSGKAKQVAKTAYSQFETALDFTTVDLNPMELLLTYLANPEPETWEGLSLASVSGVTAASDSRTIAAGDVEATLGSMIEGVTPGWPEPPEEPFALAAMGGSTHGVALGLLLRTADANAMYWTACAALNDDPAVLDTDDHRQRWHDWLQWANILQFLNSPGRDAIICAASESSEDLLDGLYVMSAAKPGAPSPAETTEPTKLSDYMAEELEFVDDDEIRDLVRRLLESGAPDFVAGPDISGHAPPAAGWPEQKLAVVETEWEGDLPEDWTVVQASDANVEEILTLVGAV